MRPRDATRARLREHAQQVASKLQHMAREIEALLAEDPSSWHKEEGSHIAYRIQHAVLWGVANMDLDQLTTTAIDHDMTLGA